MCVPPLSRASQIHKLAESTGLNAVFCAKTRGLGGEYGVAILSRYDVLETCRIRLNGWSHHSSNRYALTAVHTMHVDCFRNICTCPLSLSMDACALYHAIECCSLLSLPGYLSAETRGPCRKLPLLCVYGPPAFPGTCGWSPRSLVTTRLDRNRCRRCRTSCTSCATHCGPRLIPTTTRRARAKNVHRWARCTRCDASWVCVVGCVYTCDK